jgi:hypothetical protein
VDKIAKEMSLMDQAFIKDTSLTVAVSELAPLSWQDAALGWQGAVPGWFTPAAAPAAGLMPPLRCCLPVSPLNLPACLPLCPMLPALPACPACLQEHIKAQIASIGENIQVRRFGRYVLGEGIQVSRRSTGGAGTGVGWLVGACGLAWVWLEV